MFTVKRSKKNPLISPESHSPYEAYSTFNGAVLQVGTTTHMLYRAQSLPETIDNNQFSLSSIGHAVSTDGINFKDRKEFIIPEKAWERYGCEDPRFTKIGSNYYIFYTALSLYPFGPDGIKVGVAVSKDLKKIDVKHLVTPFNAKAMSLFPEKIDGKYVALLSVNTDRPPLPSTIALAKFDKIEDMWNPAYWEKWYKNLDKHALTIPRYGNDQVELGAAPIKTKDGWLLVYSHIQNYQSNQKIFGIECILLDSENPQKIIGKTRGPILVPEESYELYGAQPNIIFPSGSMINKTKKGDVLSIYYGATDTTVCLAELPLKPLLESMKYPYRALGFQRLSEEPVLVPNPNLPWQAFAVFNPTLVDIARKIHILYRAMSRDNTSTVGYAQSKDGKNIILNLDYPIYIPRENFERKGIPNGNSGCEDPRVTLIGDTLYMCYTAYNGIQPPQVAMTSISKDNFLNQIWNWSKPVLITRDGVDDKDACIHPEKVNGKYFLFHRVNHTIVGDFGSTLQFPERNNFKNIAIIHARPGMWDGVKVGIAASPLKTKYGWVLLYHGVARDSTYRVGAALLDLKDPTIVLSRTTDPVFEPMKKYEKEGQINNVVFPCGAIVRDDTILIYYGAADSVINVASLSMEKLLEALLV